jgi:hypothetical protein
MRKASPSTQRRKRSVTLDLTARKAGGTKGGIIAVLIGLLRPQPEAQPAPQLVTRRG